MEDHNHMLMAEFDSDSDETSPPCECIKTDEESIFKDDEQNEQIQSDEILARQLESDLSWANVKNKDDISHNDVLQSDLPFSEVVVIDESGSTLTADNDVEQQVTKNINFFEELSKRVDTTGMVGNTGTGTGTGSC